ncbi:MAG: hypothetical protein JST00_31275 [Deltaproteobacteria bacterium]|nr:hypothetical protein [Deltaproteobacteria bacterium]
MRSVVALTLGMTTFAAAGCNDKASQRRAPSASSTQPASTPTPSAAASRSPNVPSGAPDATALCARLFPCPPHAADEVPYMCSLEGTHDVAPRRAAGMWIARVTCRFRKAGSDAFVGVPDEDGGALLQDDALRARLRDHPELLAESYGASPSLCPVTRDAAGLRFCRGSPRSAIFHCLVAPDGSRSCAQSDPDRMLRACREVTKVGVIKAEERYWGPGACAVPVDHVREGRPQGTLPIPRGTSQLGDSTKITLTMRGREVRTLSCGVVTRDADYAPTKDYYLVDGDERVTSEEELLRGLDDDDMRASVFAIRLRASWAVLLAPTGGEGAVERALGDGGKPCTFAPRPTRRGNILELHLTAPIGGQPHTRCRADLTTLGGVCEPLPLGTFCD